MLAVLACTALLSAGPDAPPVDDTRRAYQEARAGAGRSPEDQVRLALWCEAHGLTAERLHHLTLAVLADPKNATARGLMGLVSRDGRWQRPEALADRLKADQDHAATLAEYEAKRLKAAYTADAQWALGTWCDEHGLKEQAKAHLTVVIRLDPSREHAWKRLGYKRHEGRWATDAQLAAEKSEAEAQKQADKAWRPLIDRYKSMLDQPSRREEAEAALAEVTDPRAVPAILHAFGKGREGDQLRAVQLLGQVDSPSASRSLAGLAVLSKSPEVRRVAVETLKRRDPRDFVRLWIALIRKPIKYEVRPVGGPGSPGTLFVEGQKANLRRVYAPPPLPTIPYLPGAMIGYDENGLPVIHQPLTAVEGSGRIPEPEFRKLQAAERENRTKAIASLSNQLAQSTGGDPQQLAGLAGRVSDPYDNIYNPKAFANMSGVGYRPVFSREFDVPIGEMVRETQASAAVAQRQLASDVATLDRTNATIRESNEPVLQALKGVTGADLGEDGAAWNRWWTDREGYAVMTSQDTAKPTFFEDVPLGYTPQAGPAIVAGPVIGFVRSHSCFAGGTTVRTIEGERPIESIRAGDLVLVQDTNSGGLAYQAVVTAYHNPPSPTLRVGLEGGEAVVVTGIHRFWKAGKGWTMARDLKAGDLVRALGGVATVSAVEDDRTQPVFNLEVAEGHSFLVGKLGALVHDNSLVEATPNPFDAPAPAVAKAAK